MTPPGSMPSQPATDSAFTANRKAIFERLIRVHGFALSPADSQTIDHVYAAFHEAGHALVACKVPYADPVHKVTIIPRGMALGVTMQLPVEEVYKLKQRSQRWLSDIAARLGKK